MEQTPAGTVSALTREQSRRPVMEIMAEMLEAGSRWDSVMDALVANPAAATLHVQLFPYDVFADWGRPTQLQAMTVSLNYLPLHTSHYDA